MERTWFESRYQTQHLARRQTRPPAALANSSLQATPAGYALTVPIFDTNGSYSPAGLRSLHLTHGLVPTGGRAIPPAATSFASRPRAPSTFLRHPLSAASCAAFFAAASAASFAAFFASAVCAAAFGMLRYRERHGTASAAAMRAPAVGRASRGVQTQKETAEKGNFFWCEDRGRYRPPRQYQHRSALRTPRALGTAALFVPPTLPLRYSYRSEQV